MLTKLVHKINCNYDTLLSKITQMNITFLIYQGSLSVFAFGEVWSVYVSAGMCGCVQRCVCVKVCIMLVYMGMYYN